MSEIERAEQLYRRLLQQESARLETRRRELEDAEAVIADLTSRRTEALRQDVPPVEPVDIVSGDQSLVVFEHAVRTTTGPIRMAMRSTDTTAARDDRFVRWAQAQVAAGRVLRTIYPSSFLQDGHVHEAMWIRSWADVGEQQRLMEEVPHGFAVFGDELVATFTEWGAVTEDIAVIRLPVLVQVFVALFDAAWRAALPVPQTRQDSSDDRLLAMLASGLKDEAIARYLGVSLRTVRRRVAALMAQHDAQTRFQLGLAAERRGLLQAR